MQENKHFKENMAALLEAAKASPDLVPPIYRPRRAAGAHPLTGSCYIVCEALCHLNPGKFKPMVVWHEGGTHWFLKDRTTGEVLDPTAAQFATPVPHELGRGCGFLTRSLSSRTTELLRRATFTGLKGFTDE